MKALVALKRGKLLPTLTLMAGLLVTGMAVTANVPASRPAVSTGGPPQIRRLTEAQYRNVIADIFGPDIKVEGRFEADMISDDLAAIGSSKVSVTAAGAEYYTNLAEGIADQLLSEERRARFVPCTPKDPRLPDNRCSAKFVALYGEQLFRRPLSPGEIATRVSLAENGTRKLQDFYSGLRYAVVSLLIAPDFLFRIEAAVPTPNGAELDPWSRASRLSFLLWNGPPDAALLTAARNGELATPEGLARQVDRMMASPMLERGVRAFFSDMLGFQTYATLAKDGVIYPNFSQGVAAASREQTLRTIVDHLITRDEDYGKLFTTRRVFLNRDLGALYRYPVAAENGWEAVELPESMGASGILTQASFVALHSHPGRSSPTLRGLAVLEKFLCQHVPPPPSDVDFSLVQDINNASLRTARLRLTAHMTNPTCSGCHKLMDPIGFALENFDGAGQRRLDENGAPIDTSGELNGVKFGNAQGLGAALANDPATARCLVNRVVGYGLGRVPVRGERRWVAQLNSDFNADGRRFKALLRRVATSEGFYAVDEGQPSAPAPRTAQTGQVTAGRKPS